MAKEIVNGGVYSFTTIVPSLLGGTYVNAKVSGIVSYDAAKIFDPNIDAVQQAVLPYLAVTSSTKHTSYVYYVFTTQTGALKVFASEWINHDSVHENTLEFLDIRVSGASASDLPAIKHILGLSGWFIVNEIK